MIRHEIVHGYEMLWSDGELRWKLVRFQYHWWFEQNNCKWCQKLLILKPHTCESNFWELLLTFHQFLVFLFHFLFLLFFVPFYDMLFSTRLPLLWHMNNCEKYQFETWWKTILQLEASQALIRVRHSKLSNHMLCKAFAAKLTLRMSLNWV